MILLINKGLEICLKVAGLGPFRYNILCFVIIASTIITSLPFQCWKLVEFKTTDPDLFVATLGYISGQLLAIIKLICMQKNKRCINQLLLQINDEWSVKSLPTDWVNLAWYSRVFCTLDIASYQISSLLYCLDSIITYSIGNKPIEERKLMLAAKYPFAFTSPVYEVLVLMQYIQCSVLVLVDSLGKTLLVVFVLHVSVNINTLKDYIHNYSSKLSNSDINDVIGQRYLKQIIRQHIKILILVREIDETYSEMIFFQILFSGVMICITSFSIISRLKLSNAVLLFKFTTLILLQFSQCFAFCFTGQYLRNKGELVSNMTYTIPWYYSVPKEMKTVALALNNSQTELELSGKIFVLSMNSFAKILKTAASYLSVLRAMYA